MWVGVSGVVGVRGKGWDWVRGEVGQGLGLELGLEIGHRLGVRAGARAWGSGWVGRWFGDGLRVRGWRHK